MKDKFDINDEVIIVKTGEDVIVGPYHEGETGVVTFVDKEWQTVFVKINGYNYTDDDMDDHCVLWENAMKKSMLH